jgi:hypothetical protein
VNEITKSLKVNESLAFELIAKDWVKSVNVETKTTLDKKPPVKTHIRVVVHVDESIRTKDDYNNQCCDIMSDPLFEGINMKYKRMFYDTCIYLQYSDSDKNTLDIILSLPYSFREEDKAKLYSAIGDCEMTASTEPIEYISWSCKVS